MLLISTEYIKYLIKFKNSTPKYSKVEILLRWEQCVNNAEKVAYKYNILINFLM